MAGQGPRGLVVVLFTDMIAASIVVGFTILCFLIGLMSGTDYRRFLNRMGLLPAGQAEVQGAEPGAIAAGKKNRHVMRNRGCPFHIRFFKSLGLVKVSES